MLHLYYFIFFTYTTSYCNVYARNELKRIEIKIVLTDHLYIIQILVLYSDIFVFIHPYNTDTHIVFQQCEKCRLLILYLWRCRDDLRYLRTLYTHYKTINDIYSASTATVVNVGVWEEARDKLSRMSRESEIRHNKADDKIICAYWKIFSTGGCYRQKYKVICLFLVLFVSRSLV